MTHTESPPNLYYLWCSFPECLGYARYEVGFDGPHVCRKHAREIRSHQRVSYLTRLLRSNGATS